jgi:hypothetical protein
MDGNRECENIKDVGFDWNKSKVFLVKLRQPTINMRDDKLKFILYYDLNTWSI